MLKFFTRGQTSPIGKQSVYFAASKKDFGYLNDVARHILGHIDVAVYYDDQNNTENTTDGELWGMDLIVVVLSKDALNGMCDTFSRVIPRAYTKNIPILPLAVENGVGGPFSNFCSVNHMNKMHVLYPNKTEAASLSFSQKLQDYLKNTLVEHEDRERIYRNFSGSAFLSYRKTDRAYAIDLIKLIQRNEECRDCAIWYDEYLTAGESYDAEIKSYIDFCPVFLFLVTDNMIKEDNYAIREEYKRAKELDKHIIVVDMIAQNHTLPAYIVEGNRYIGLQDIGNLPAVISEYIEKKAFTDEEEKWNHTYYLGLAYVHGIGVEKDETYGSVLVETAAQKGLLKAMKTMVDLCMRRKDIQSTIMWQGCLKEYYEKVFRNREDLESLQEYVKNLSYQGSYYELIPDANGMLECFGETLSLLQEYNGWETDEEILDTAIIACDKLGNLCYGEWNPSDASTVELLQRAQQYYMLENSYALKYDSIVKSFRAKRYIYTSMMRIADILSYTTTPIDEVIAEYKKVLVLMHQADDETPCHDSRADLFGCYQRLAELYVRKSAELAMPYALKMLDYARQTWLEQYEMRRCLKYALALEFTAKLQVELGEIKEAIRNLNKATQAREAFFETRLKMGMKEKDTIYAMICDSFLLFDLHLSQGNYDASAEALEVAENVILIYYVDEVSGESISKLWDGFCKLSVHAQNIGNAEKASEYLEKALYYGKLISAVK